MKLSSVLAVATARQWLEPPDSEPGVFISADGLALDLLQSAVGRPISERHPPKLGGNDDQTFSDKDASPR